MWLFLFLIINAAFLNFYFNQKFSLETLELIYH
jgi:hypothetical protein